MNGIKRGVYFLANDYVYESAVAFLNSFRFHNPDSNLCLIPFDGSFGELNKLKDTYRFSVYDNISVLNRCDEISRMFHGTVLGAYRKLAIWEGDFEEFAYIDSDTVLLSDIDFVFEHLKHTDVFTSHSNIPEIRKWVWKDTIFDQKVLTKTQIYFSANTGFIVSRKGVLSLSYAESKTAGALKLKGHMALFCMEQPFLNFLIVTSGRKYGSLLSFLRRMFFNKNLKKRIKVEMWAGTKGATVEGGKLITDTPQPVFLLHWAGGWLSGNKNYEAIPYYEIWRHYRNLNVTL